MTLKSQDSLPASKAFFSPRNRILITVGIWLVLVGIFFWPILFQEKVLAPLDILDSLLHPWAVENSINVHNAFTYDAISQYLPYDWSVYQSLRQDGYIGWNPFTHSGNSIVENTMICPGDWRHQLYRILPFWPAWNLGIMLQFAIAGLGMLLLLQSKRIPPAYALLGVIAFGFYSQFILWIYHRWLLGALCWAPWIVWALHRARRKEKILDGFSILFIALAFRGGHLQACVFVVLLVMLIAASDWWLSSRRFHISTILRCLLPYAVCGGLGALFALDVFMETIPPYLHGGKPMPSKSWFGGILALPTLITSLFPASLGTPQGIDLMKGFRQGLFSIKFMGAVALILAFSGFFRRQAPLAAKFLFAVGLILPFTPADMWLYSRVTVIFALGASWLAAWYLHQASRESPSSRWRWFIYSLLAITLLWLIASLVVSINFSAIESRMHDLILSRIPENKTSRRVWMLSRATQHLHSFFVWAPNNLLIILLIAAGLFCCSKINKHNHLAPYFGVLVALFTFGELFLFSRTWITFAEAPQSDGLYSKPSWVSMMKNEMGNGTIYCLDRSDFDYMQLNTPSAYGLRFAQGYETVTPKRIVLPQDTSFSPSPWAASGVSHLLVSPENDPGRVMGWDRAIQSEELVMYRNPRFQSVYTATLVSGEIVPVYSTAKTPNQRHFVLPQSTISMDILESYNSGWQYSVDGRLWHPVLPTDIHAMHIDLGKETAESPLNLCLRFRPAHRHYYISFMGIVLFGIILVKVTPWPRKKTETPFP